MVLPRHADTQTDNTHANWSMHCDQVCQLAEELKLCHGGIWPIASVEGGM